MDRALASGAKGRGFDSRLACHFMFLFLLFFTGSLFANQFDYTSSRDLINVMRILDFGEGDTVVPPFFNKQLPSDLRTLTRKQRIWVFSAVMLPLILRENRFINNEREKTQVLLSRFPNLNEQEMHTLLLTLKRYKIIQKARTVSWLLTIDQKTKTHIDQAADIKIRPVSPALTLSQAALESGWGTSRFVRIANNIFGQHTGNSRYGVRPKHWKGKANQNIKLFTSIEDSIAAYMLNLNRNRTYRFYRKLRQRYPKQPLKQIYGFKNYSEIGMEYVKRLQIMLIRFRFIVYTEAHLDHSRRIERLSAMKAFYFY